MQTVVLKYKVAVNKDLVEMNSVNFGKATDDVRARIDKDSARFFNGSENIGVTPKRYPNRKHRYFRTSYFHKIWYVRK